MLVLTLANLLVTAMRFVAMRVWVFADRTRADHRGDNPAGRQVSDIRVRYPTTTDSYLSLSRAGRGTDPPGRRGL